MDERSYDDTLDEGYSPPEKPLGVTRYGTTAAEQHDGESLDQRLAEEVPDADRGIDGGAAGAEEAAMHVVDDERLPQGDEGP